MGALKSISQETFIPLGVAIVVIGTAAAWATNVATQIQAHKEILEQLKSVNDSNFKMVYEINSRLSRIEWRLEKESTTRGDKHVRN